MLLPIMDMWLSGLRRTANTVAVVLKRIGNPCIHQGFESSHVHLFATLAQWECSCFVNSWLWVQVLQVAPLRPFSSVGQSRRLIIVLSTVQVSEGPPFDNMYPKSRFRVHVSAICTQKHCFGYISFLESLAQLVEQ